MNLGTGDMRRRGLCWSAAALLALAPLSALAQESVVEALRRLLAELEGVPGNERMVDGLRKAIAQKEGTPAEPLILSPVAGRAPLTVSILGPAGLLERLKSAGPKTGACRIKQPAGPADFVVDWQDGPIEYFALREGCPQVLKHVYGRQGTYAVTAEFLGPPGPTDGGSIEWRGKAEVHVEAPKKP